MMRRYRYRWYERLGIERPFPWVLVGIVAAVLVAAVVGVYGAAAAMVTGT